MRSSPARKLHAELCMKTEELSSDDGDLLRSLEDEVRESRSFRRHREILQRRAHIQEHLGRVRRMFFLARQSYTAACRQFEDLKQSFCSARQDFFTRDGRQEAPSPPDPPAESRSRT